jgi:hypothetical protein
VECKLSDPEYVGPQLGDIISTREKQKRQKEDPTLKDGGNDEKQDSEQAEETKSSTLLAQAEPASAIQILALSLPPGENPGEQEVGLDYKNAHVADSSTSGSQSGVRALRHGGGGDSNLGRDDASEAAFDHLLKSADAAKVIAVDLDGTLAEHTDAPFDPEHVGEPIPAMVARVKRWIAEGKQVIIFTARASEPRHIPPIRRWLKEQGLGGLKVTNRKTPDIVQLWDDRAVRVERNTGHGILDGRLKTANLIPIEERLKRLRQRRNPENDPALAAGEEARTQKIVRKILETDNDQTKTAGAKELGADPRNLDQPGGIPQGPGGARPTTGPEAIA